MQKQFSGPSCYNLCVVPQQFHKMLTKQLPFDTNVTHWTEMLPVRNQTLLGKNLRYGKGTALSGNAFPFM